VLKFLKIGKWIFLSSSIILASLFALHLFITPDDDGKTMLILAIGLFGLYLRNLRAERRIGRTSN